MAKFTPGPWEIDTNGPFTAEMVGIYQPILEEYVVLFRNQDTPDESELVSEANAHLIAAAPDLYEAMEAIRSAILGPDGPSGRNLWAIPIAAESKLHAALAKANGEEQA